MIRMDEGGFRLMPYRLSLIVWEKSQQDAQDLGETIAARNTQVLVHPALVGDDL